jgi:hypothetical protein
MAKQKSDSIPDNQDPTTQAAERGPVTPVAFALHTIKLHDGVNEDEFEKFMLEELFQSVDTNPNGESDQHTLLNGGSQDEYVWMSRLEYEIHHTPLPTWLLNRVESMVNDDVRKELEPYGTDIASTVYYDVAGWRQRLGK